MVRLKLNRTPIVNLWFFGFNPTMVRLKQISGFDLGEIEGCFNPTMVRLKPKEEAYTLIGKGGFNPTMVRLKLPVSLIVAGIFLCFNPTMVRLKLAGTVAGKRPGCFNPTMVRLKLNLQ